MRLPAVSGVIRRRILVNFNVDPGVMQAQVPAPFEPKLHAGRAVAGVCLIRLEQIRPKGLPAVVGVSSENAAHRVAVTWTDDDGRELEGVFIPRRDTDSHITTLLGDRVFSGEHHAARFRVEDEGPGGRVELSMTSRDGTAAVAVQGHTADALPAGSVFTSVAEASAFFEAGSLGYSATKEGHRLNGLRLETRSWHVDPLGVRRASSSWLEDTSRFPSGSVEFDNALIMRDVTHEWHEADELYTG